MAEHEGRTSIRRLIVPRLGDTAATWDDLVTQAAVPSPFLRSWWLDAVADEKSEFILVLDAGTVVGGIALERRRRVLGVPIYRFAGSGALCPDHLDLLAARGKEGIVRAAITEWFTQSGSRVLDLEGLVEDSLLEQTFPAARTTTTDLAPWDQLPASAAEYVVTLSANLRKTLRQTKRRFAAAGVSHRRISYRNASRGDNAAAAALDEFTELQKLRGGRGALLRETPRLVPALMVGLDRGEVRIDILETDDRVILVLISFQLARAVRLYQSARRLDDEWRDALAVALLEVVRQACEDGCRELDLLRGDESYKSRFVRRKRQIRHLRAAHGLFGAVILATMGAFRRLRNLAGRVRRRLRKHSARRGPRGMQSAASG
jgi:CelD/BcsL family acetyltransferase involved in cellulose biosynthesis